MTFFNIPKTEIKVSRVILGCWAFAGGDYWGNQEEKESVKTIHAALDRGINALDTALAYGNGISEKAVGNAVKGRRDSVIIYDKIPAGKLKYDEVIESAHSILKNLDTDYVDVMQIHWGDRAVPISETLGAMERLKKEGKIRHFGVSNFGPELLKETIGIMMPVSNQLSYSLLSRAVEFEIQPVCGENNIGILAYSPLQQGLLAGKYLSLDDFPKGRIRTRHFSSDHEGVRHGEQGHETETFKAVNSIYEFCGEKGLNMADASLAWVLAQPSLDGVIVGARTEEQIEENVKAVELVLEKDTVQHLSALTDNLKEQMGPNADLWGRESRIW
jgi:myo-inositol catabolism protein IolS